MIGPMNNLILRRENRGCPEWVKQIGSSVRPGPKGSRSPLCRRLFGSLLLSGLFGLFAFWSPLSSFVKHEWETFWSKKYQFPVCVCVWYQNHCWAKRFTQKSTRHLIHQEEKRGGRKASFCSLTNSWIRILRDGEKEKKSGRRQSRLQGASDNGCLVAKLSDNGLI